MLKRVQELKRLGILDTEEEEIFNDIVRSASTICEAPISLITLLDEERQWFKAKIGTEVEETPIGISVCNHTIKEENGIMLIEDLTSDSRFANNPYVVGGPNLKSYAGVSLVASQGERIGTVCVFDNKVRRFDKKQVFCLETLAKFTIKLIDEKVLRLQVEKQNQLLINLNKNLQSFTYMVAHDVKAPIRIISSYSKIISEDQSNSLSQESKEYLSYIQASSENLKEMVDNLLDYSKQIQIDSEQFKLINIRELIEEKISLLDFKREHLTYEFEELLLPIFFSKPVLEQCLQNVISNAINYKDKSKTTPQLKITSSVVGDYTVLSFEDNGIGMSEIRLHQVFDPFKIDTRFEKSSGIGLCVVKELLEKVGGKIDISSQLKKGTTVNIYIPN